jgi:hypothetical protein
MPLLARPSPFVFFSAENSEVDFYYFQLSNNYTPLCLLRFTQVPGLTGHEVLF